MTGEHILLTTIQNKKNSCEWKIALTCITNYVFSKSTLSFLGIGSESRI